jgi:Uncharacterized conserved protein (COG2071)
MPRADQASESKSVFLSAEWRDLAMLNYQASPRLLQPYVPRGTELDSFARDARGPHASSSRRVETIRHSHPNFPETFAAASEIRCIDRLC